MISTSWLQKRRPYWARIDELLARSGGSGVRALTHTELQEFALLYRQTASDLATIREDSSSRNLAHYLNQLLGRAHNLIYMGRRSRPIGVIKFYRETFPQIFHETLPYTITATAIFFATAAAGLMVALVDPGFQRYILGPAMMDTIEKQQMWTHSIVSVKPLESSHIMTNNLAVSLTTFALGITGGLGTVLMLAFNGLLFGSDLRSVLARRDAGAAHEFRRAARSDRIAGYFHCRRRGTFVGERLAVSRNVAAPRIAGSRRRPRGASGAGDYSDAHRRGHN